MSKISRNYPIKESPRTWFWISGYADADTPQVSVTIQYRTARLPPPDGHAKSIVDEHIYTWAYL